MLLVLFLISLDLKIFTSRRRRGGPRTIYGICRGITAEVPFVFSMRTRSVGSYLCLAFRFSLSSTSVAVLSGSNGRGI